MSKERFLLMTVFLFHIKFILQQDHNPHKSASDHRGNEIDSVFEIMKKYEMKGNFAHSLVDETMITDVEKRLVFADTTIELRKLGVLDNLIAIEDCDEWWYCIENKSQKIVLKKKI